jgi:hypothetical protein
LQQPKYTYPYNHKLTNQKAPPLGGWGANQKMAQFTFTNNTYAGEALAGFMASTLLEADSVKRGLLTVINDVKQRKIILDVDDDVVLQNPSGIFTDQGTTATQTESYLDPVVYEFMKQEQWDKLVQSWETQQLKPGAFLDYEGVVDLSDFMVQRYLTKIQIANERLYWLGKGSTKEAAFTAPFTGLLPSIAAANGVYKVGLRQIRNIYGGNRHQRIRRGNRNQHRNFKRWRCGNHYRRNRHH